MKTSKFTEEQIAFTLKQAELGTPVKEVIRKVGITEQTFYRWKKKYGGQGMNELRRLRQLEEENRRLRQMVADLSLDKHMLQEALNKGLTGASHLKKKGVIYDAVLLLKERMVTTIAGDKYIRLEAEDGD